MGSSSTNIFGRNMMMMRFNSNLPTSLPFVTLSSFPMKQQESKMRTQINNIHLIQKPVIRHEYLVASCSSSSAEDVNIHSDSTKDPESDHMTMIQNFYGYVNNKKLDKIHDRLAEDCYLEECSFPQPLQGKKEVMKFFSQLVEGMGQNVKFKTENIVISQGGDHAAVLWHLEWNQEEIPFTRGCSYYQFSQDQQHGVLLIRKARLFIESPIKPGALVLILLKNVTKLFDDNPKATQWLLRKPHLIANFLMKVYSKILAPFIVNPLISGYITMWSFIARIIGLMFNLLLFITKFLP